MLHNCRPVRPKSTRRVAVDSLWRSSCSRKRSRPMSCLRRVTPLRARCFPRSRLSPLLACLQKQVRCCSRSRLRTTCSRRSGTPGSGSSRPGSTSTSTVGRGDRCEATPRLEADRDRVRCGSFGCHGVHDLSRCHCQSIPVPRQHPATACCSTAAAWPADGPTADGTGSRAVHDAAVIRQLDARHAIPGGSAGQPGRQYLCVAELDGTLRFDGVG